jgi:hypothetical protein
MSGKQFIILILSVTLLAGLTVLALSYAPIELAWLMVLTLGAAYLLRRFGK